MKFDLDSWEEIITTLTRNKTRSLLTAFGVFWGIYMLVMLIGLSNGLKELMQNNFENSAQNTMYIMPNLTTKPYKGFQSERRWRMELADIDIIRKDVHEIDKICPVVMAWGDKATKNELESNINVNGTVPDYAHLEDPQLLYGRFINDIDIQEKRKVCVIGKQVYNDLYPDQNDPTGESIEIGGVYYQIIGVAMSEPNMSVGGPPARRVTLPITTSMSIYNMGNKIDILYISGKPSVQIATIQDKVSTILKETHHIDPTDEQAVTILNTQAIFSMVDSLFKGINSLSWLVGIGTLLAGVIGVSNIMMVTVRERTTEIGIRRAIGALPNDILVQVLLESVVLTILSGLIGVTLAVLSLQGVESIVNSDRLFPINFQVSFWLAIGTSLALVLLGLVAGLAPAYRAMSINPIAAIQDE